MKRILFISHDASRTGAPIVLLELLKWFNKYDKSTHIDVLLLSGGELEEDFMQYCFNLYKQNNTIQQEKFFDLFKKKIKKKIGIKIKSTTRSFIEQIAQNNYDLIYANTTVSIPFGCKIKTLSNNAKLLVHVHELNIILKMVLPDFKRYTGFIDNFIAVSTQVKDNLVENYGINANSIDVIHPFSKEIKKYKKNNHKFIVGASGSVTWRKGYDLFIQTAFFVKNKYPELNIQFQWLGDFFGMEDVVLEDLKKSDLVDYVEFLGLQQNPDKFYSNFNLFLMLSREDPFPLVCIEMASINIPIICFDKGVGSVEILKPLKENIVPYLNVEKIAERIVYYYNNRESIKKDGIKTKELFSSVSKEKSCKSIIELIQSLSK